MRSHHSKKLSSGDKISPYFMCVEGWLKSTECKYFRTENGPCISGEIIYIVTGQEYPLRCAARRFLAIVYSSLAVFFIAHINLRGKRLFERHSPGSCKFGLRRKC
jgi:hypothetical protein